MGKKWKESYKRKSCDSAQPDIGVLGHMVTVFAISLFVGFLTFHSSLLWNQMQTEYTFPFPRDIHSNSFFDKYYGLARYDYPTHVDLRANTSIFIH